MSGRGTVGRVTTREMMLAVALIAFPVGVDQVLRHRALTVGPGIEVVEHRQGFGSLAVNRNFALQPLRIDHVTYSRGLGTHADSRTELKLQRGTKKLLGACGIDFGACAEGSVRFRIKAEDQRVLFESPVMHASDAALTFVVPVDDSRRVFLETDGQGSIACDHADWVDLEVAE